MTLKSRRKLQALALGLLAAASVTLLVATASASPKTGTPEVTSAFANPYFVPSGGTHTAVISHEANATSCSLVVVETPKAVRSLPVAKACSKGLYTGEITLWPNTSSLPRVIGFDVVAGGVSRPIAGAGFGQGSARSDSAATGVFYVVQEGTATPVMPPSPPTTSFPVLPSTTTTSPGPVGPDGGVDDIGAPPASVPTPTTGLPTSTTAGPFPTTTTVAIPSTTTTLPPVTTTTLPPSTTTTETPHCLLWRYRHHLAWCVRWS